MDGYEVEIEELRRAADAVTSAGEQASEVKSSPAVTGVPDAMPGSETSPAITDWADWFDRERLNAWSTAALEHGDRLTESADRYAEDEEAATRAFSGPGGGATPE